METDVELICCDYVHAWPFTAAERSWLEDRGMTATPRRCKPCRRQRRLLADGQARSRDWLEGR